MPEPMIPTHLIEFVIWQGYRGTQCPNEVGIATNAAATGPYAQRMRGNARFAFHLSHIPKEAGR